MNICMLFRIQVERKNKKLRWDRYATRITFYSLQRWDGNVTAECKSTHYTLIHSYTPYTMNMYNSYHLLLSSIYTWNSNDKRRRRRGRKKFVHMRIVSVLFVMTFEINVGKALYLLRHDYKFRIFHLFHIWFFHTHRMVCTIRARRVSCS